MDEEVDTRPLHEKLQDQVKPVVYTIDITNGREFKISGTAHDIERVRKACKQKMREIEDKGLTNERHLVVIPAREL
jgi:malonyl CoA-acyl carrier protein transacylase